MTLDQSITLFVALLCAVFAFPNIYMLCQWLVHPQQRRRLRVCKPYFAIAWASFTLALIAAAAPLGVHYIALRGECFAAMYLASAAFAFTAAIRLLRANAAERRAARAVPVAPPLDGEVWPPPPVAP